MKKEWSVLLMVLLLLLAGCSAQRSAPDTPNALVPSFVYEGVRYGTTGEAVPAAVVEEAYLGYIESIVPLSQWPEEDNQANFPCEGQPFALCDGEMLLLIDAEWTRFVPMDAEE